MNSKVCHSDNTKTEIKTLKFHYDRRESSGNPAEIHLEWKSDDPIKPEPHHAGLMGQAKRKIKSHW